MADTVRVRQRHWVYILLHWLIVGALTILAFTGLYIHKPFFSLGSGPDPVMIMSWIRWIHFITAAVLIESVAIRVELSFFSHFDADWREVGPSVKQFKQFPEALSYFLFARNDHRYWRKLNPVMSVILVPFMLLFYLIAILTGFALFQGTFFWKLTSTNTLFGWVFSVFGGQQPTRTWHYYLFWVFVCLGAIHIYLSILRTVRDRDNTFRSMLNGWRLVPRKFAPIKGASGSKKKVDK
jgi:Ni/Fe-hydrogenase 1 B-type cytochrome subunit